jgi:hypothetical protein
MLAVADEGDGSRLFKVLKRPVFDLSAYAKVFVEPFIRNGEQLIAADGMPPVQPDCNGQLLFGVHQRQYTLQPFKGTANVLVGTSSFRRRTARERLHLDAPSVPGGDVLRFHHATSRFGMAPTAFSAFMMVAHIVFAIGRLS